VSVLDRNPPQRGHHVLGRVEPVLGVHVGRGDELARLLVGCGLLQGLEVIGYVEQHVVHGAHVAPVVAAQHDVTGQAGEVVHVPAHLDDALLGDHLVGAQLLELFREVALAQDGRDRHERNAQGDDQRKKVGPELDAHLGSPATLQVRPHHAGRFSGYTYTHCATVVHR